MRRAFIGALAELAETNPSIVLLTGDLGYMALEPFSERFPDRFFNVGVAEQNLVGLATGLAESGLVPFVYSIVPFAVLRPYEFIRNGPIQHQFPVRIVGVGGGFEYGNDGFSHYGLEDVGVLRIHPGMRVIAPADFQQARSALEATWNLPGPAYYRLGKDDTTVVSGLDGRFELGRVQVIRDGGDLLLIAMGAVTTEVVAAAETLAEQSVSATIAVVASVRPEPADDLAELLARFPVALTVEAHYVTGGLGSLVSEVIAERGIACRLRRCGVRSGPTGTTGSTAYVHRQHGLSGADLAAAALEQLGR